MALYVVLEDFSGRTELEEGQVIDGRLFDVEELQRSGLAVFPLVDPSMRSVIDAFQNQRRLGKRYTIPWGDLLPLLLGSRGGASGIGTLTGESVEDRLGGAAASRVFGEVPAGAIDGANANFVTTSTFLPGTQVFYYNGVRQTEGVGCDYVISESGGAGTGFDTFVTAYFPRLGDTVAVDYTLG